MDIAALLTAVLLLLIGVAFTLLALTTSRQRHGSLGRFLSRYYASLCATPLVGRLYKDLVSEDRYFAGSVAGGLVIGAICFVASVLIVIRSFS